jgi:hypothetical protein
MDASVNCGPFAACTVTAGMKSLARYYSLSASKAITRTVAQAFSAAARQDSVGVYGSGLTSRTLRAAGLEANLVQIAPDRKIRGGRLAIDDHIA